MIRTMATVLALALLAGTPGCEDNPPPEEAATYLVVMSAFQPELTKLLREADVHGTLPVGEATCYIRHFSRQRSRLATERHRTG